MALTTRTKYGLLLLVAVALFIHFLGPILMPFVVGAGLAYLGDPLVDRLEAWHLPRTAAVALVFAGLILIIVILVLLLFPLLQQQTQIFIGNLPRYGDWIQRHAQPVLEALLPNTQHISADVVKQFLTEHAGAASDFAATLFKSAFSSGTKIVAILVQLVFIPVVSFYLLRDWDRFRGWVQGMVPRRNLPSVNRLASETDAVLGQFMRGQLLVMLGLALTYTIGLWLAGLNVALLIGLGAGLVTFVPYLGLIVGVRASSIAMLVQTGDPMQLIWIAVVFGIGQIMESAVLQPLLLGDRIGLHPVAVIFAVLAGGQLFGFVGVLLALPAAAAIAVLVRHTDRVWKHSNLYLDDE